MFIKIKQFLEQMDRWEKEGIPASELGLRGTFAVICQPKGYKGSQFLSVDGYIQYMDVILDYCVERYGQVHPEWKKS